MGDYRTTKGEAPPATRRERRRGRVIVLLALVCLLTGIVLTGSLVKVQRYVEAAGYVTTEHYAEVRPPTLGTVAEILVESGDSVEKGELLARLDATAEQATLEEAKSRVSKMEAELARRRAEIEERKRKVAEEIEIAKLRLQNATTKLLRTQELLRKGLVAGSALEDDKLKEELAKAELTSLMSKDQSIYDKELAVLERDLEGRREGVTRAEARVHAKEIRAPITGQVVCYEFVIGELVRPESVLFEIFGGNKQILRLQVGERYATRVAPGQPYSARLASYRGLQQIYFTGKVEHLRNVIEGDRSGKTKYRVAYCSFDPQGRVVPPGTTGEARIYYGTSCLFYYLFGVD